MQVAFKLCQNLVYRTAITSHPLLQVPFIMRFAKEKIHQNSDDCIHNKDFVVQIHQVVDIPWDHFN